MSDSTAAVSVTGDELKATITINAAADRVWAAVSDVRRMSSWSPQVLRSATLGGPVRLGTRFVNVNRQGWKHWPTTGTVVRFEPHTDFAFRIPLNGTIWSFHLDEVDGTTVVTQRRETPDGIKPVSDMLVWAALGGQRRFVPALLEGMAQTLERLKAELEA
jgi:uncharacterized protein YndB with AHSA1/START domain